ncbi:MAG: class I SAM-dependent methyltransferase [bacterium]
MLTLGWIFGRNHDRGLLGPLTSKIREEAAQRIGETSGSVLDLGCGNGLFFDLLNQNAEAHVFGLDRSRELLEQARAKMNRTPFKAVDFLIGDAFALPFKTNHFQRVVCLNLLLNLREKSDIHRLLREVWRVCDSRARLIVDIRNLNNPIVRVKYWLHQWYGNFPTKAYVSGEIAEMLKQVGFRIVEIKPVGPVSWLIPFAYLIEAEKSD